MSLLEDVRGERVVNGPRCTVVAVRQALGDEEGAELVELLLGGDVPLTSISRALRKRGHTISAQTLGRHRAGDCRCER